MYNLIEESVTAGALQDGLKSIIYEEVYRQK